MKTIDLLEAKKNFSELVERASAGERIGITHRGKLAAVLVPARTESNLTEVFSRIEGIRRSVKPRPKGITSKGLIDEGRR